MEKLDLLSVEQVKETKTEATSVFNDGMRDEEFKQRPGSNCIKSSGMQYDTILLK